MPLPTFMVIGAAKCGTTSLCALLERHPDVFLTRPKEPKYFSRIATYEQGWDWYLSLFEGSERYAARGEGSTTYTGPARIDMVVPRLHATVPNCRLIYMVRHPIQRLESHWKMLRRSGQGLANINRNVEDLPPLSMWGMYWRWFCAYRLLFRDDQILIVFFEDFVRDPESIMARVYEHIGVDPTFRPVDAHVPRNTAREFKADTRASAIVRRIPGFGLVKRIAPKRMVEAARNALLQPYGDRAVWDPAVLCALQRMYRQDSRYLLEHCGKSEDYWRLGH